MIHAGYDLLTADVYNPANEGETGLLLNESLSYLCLCNVSGSSQSGPILNVSSRRDPSPHCRWDISLIHLQYHSVSVEGVNVPVVSAPLLPPLHPLGDSLKGLSGWIGISPVTPETTKVEQHMAGSDLATGEGA